MSVTKKLARDALLEIGTEEIPASYLPPSLSYIKSFTENVLKKNLLSCQAIHVFGTPRRLSLLMDALPLESEGRIEEVWGPSLKASKDSNGQWTQAAKGFAQSRHFSLEAVEIREKEKREYLCIRKKHEGIKSETILKELFSELVGSIPFPKKMVWNESLFKFARPIRSLVCLYGGKNLPLEIAGVKSSKKSFSLSHLSGKNILIVSPQSYLTTLKNHCVIVDPESRKKTILRSISQCSVKIKGHLKMDEDLLEEVTWLVEHPVAILGCFKEEFLTLPKEILITCMKKHQKFFSLLNAEGKLMPYFIGIRNGISEHQETVRKGYENILNARLTDAQFFFNEDLKKPLQTYLKKSGEILLREKLGSLNDKIDRMKTIAGFLGEIITSQSSNGSIDLSIVDRAIHLCKFDLGTSMVYEFSELQGVAGEIYALRYGEDPRVARAIREHYYPLNNQSELPQQPESSLVALIDRIESLVGNFLIGLTPSGNNDPYGLRRQSTGLLRIILENRWDFSLKDLIHFCSEQFSFKNGMEPDQKIDSTLKEILNFLSERFQLLMQDNEYEMDAIYSVTKNWNDPDLSHLRILNLKEKISAIHQMRHHPDFYAIASSFKRASNILKQAQSKSIHHSYEKFTPSLLQESAETELHALMTQVIEKTQPFLKQKKYQQALQEWVILKEALNQFFEKVLVMDPNPSVCENRLSLLFILESHLKQIADFSLIQG